MFGTIILAILAIINKYYHINLLLSRKTGAVPGFPRFSKMSKIIRDHNFIKQSPALAGIILLIEQKQPYPLLPDQPISFDLILTHSFLIQK